MLVTTPIFGSVDPIPYASHLHAWKRTAEELPDAEIIFHSPWRLPIDSARNQAVIDALRNECEYLFCYDSDMVLDPSILSRLIKRNKPAVAARYTIRGYPFSSAMLRFTDETKTKIKTFEASAEEEKMELLQVDAVGTGACLIKTDIFKKVNFPWFFTGATHTEDVYFFVNAAKVEGFSCWVDMTIKVGHLGEPIVIHPGNAGALKKFYEEGHSTSFYSAQQ